MQVGDLVRFGSSGLVTPGINGQLGVITDIHDGLKKAKVTWTTLPDCYHENNCWVYLRNLSLVASSKTSKTNTSYL